MTYSLKEDVRFGLDPDPQDVWQTWAQNSPLCERVSDVISTSFPTFGIIIQILFIIVAMIDIAFYSILLYQCTVYRLYYEYVNPNNGLLLLASFQFVKLTVTCA